MDILVPALQCATVLTCAPDATPLPPIKCTAPCTGYKCSSAYACPGRVLPPGTRAPITMQGLAFLPIPSAPIMFSGAPGTPAPMQSTRAPLQSAVIPPMAGAPWPSQVMPYPSAFMDPPAWPVNMPYNLHLGPRHSSPPCKSNMKSLQGNPMIWRLES